MLSSILVIMDVFRSLYTCIKHNEGLSVLGEYLSKSITKNPPRSNDNTNERHINIKRLYQILPQKINTIAFLGTLVYIDENRQLQTTQHTKPTNKHNYLYYRSSQPKNLKDSHPSSSSSLCRAASTDFLDLLSLLLPIVHRLWLVFWATSRILT